MEKADTITDKRITASEANRYVVEKVKAWAFANRKRQNPRISSNVSGEIVLTTATLPRVPPKPSVDSDPGSTPIVGTFDQIVAQIKALEAELEQKLERNRQRIAENLRQGEEEIAEFRKSHKLNAPKDMFESDDDYNKRISQLNALVAKRSEELQKRHFEDIQRSLGDTQTQSQITRLYRRIFPTNDVAITLGTYDANNEFFPITFEVNLNGESRRYNSRLSLNKEDARNLYRNWDQVIKTSYLSIDPGYRRGLAKVKLEYPPIWGQGFTCTLNEVYHLGDSNIAVTFSSDGRYLATGSANGNAIIWRVSSGEEIWRTALGNQVNAVAFSPGGKYLATGDTRNVTLWGVSDGRKIWQQQDRYSYKIYTGHVRTDWASYHAISFSPGGKYLATGDTYRRYSKVSLWEVRSGKKVQRMEPRGSVNTVSFSPDGKYLATGGGNKTVSLWKMSTAPPSLADGAWRQCQCG